MLENAASAKLYGLEGDLTVLPVQALQLNVGFNLEHSKYGNFANASGTIPGNGTVISVPLDYSGEQVLVAPKLTLNAGGSYSLDVGPGKLVFSTNYSYSSRFFTSPGTTNYIKKFGLLNSSLAFTDPSERYTVEVWGVISPTSKRSGGMDPPSTMAMCFGRHVLTGLRCQPSSDRPNCTADGHHAAL